MSMLANLKWDFFVGKFVSELHCILLLHRNKDEVHYLEFYNTGNVVLWCKLWEGHNVHAIEEWWIEYPIETIDMKVGQHAKDHFLSCLCKNTVCPHLVCSDECDYL